MSFSDWSNKKAEEEKKKKKKEERSFSDWSNVNHPAEDEDIAPVRTSDVKDEEGERSWFKSSSLWDDGYDFGDVTRTILNTAGDALQDATTGIVGIGEKLLDAGMTIAPYFAQGQYYANGGGYNLQADLAFNQGIEAQKKGSEEFVKKDLYDEEEVTKKYLLPYDVEDESVFGEKTDALAQSGGQLLAQLGANAIVPGSGMALMGATAFGSESENAIRNDATLEEAAFSGLISAGAEMLTEQISGGIKFGGKTLDDALTKRIASTISDKTVRTLAKTGMDMAGEGLEEVLSGHLSSIGQKLTYMDDKELNELFSSEDALESFIGGAVLGGVGSVSSNVISNSKGVDAVTGLTKNEQAVFDKVYQAEIAKAEENGKVTQSQKQKIYDKVMRDMERGYIDTDTIEEVLGGDSYKSYKDIVDSEDSLIEQEKTLSDEYTELNKKVLTGEDMDRKEELKSTLADLRAKIAENKKTSQRDQLKTKLGEDVRKMVQNDRLVESYLEKARVGEDFQADLNKYKGSKHEAAAKKTIENVLKFRDEKGNGVNNTNRVHDFIDPLVQISADTGLTFDLQTDEQIKDAFIARHTKKIAELEGIENRTAEDNELLANMKDQLAKVQSGELIVNGNNTADHVVLNLDSKNPLNVVVGHEVTHSVEKAKSYDKLEGIVLSHAKTKGIDIDSRLKAIEAKYAGEEGANPRAELVADLVGEFLFTDSDFVRNLSTQNRNVFQKIYDEIKYLCKIVTAGSKEARELEKLKKTFEDAYRESAEKNTSGGVQFSLENGNKRKYNKRSVYSETETKFLRWENGSSPVGEVKKFVRYGKAHYYEKTENGCVELSRSQYNERNGAYVENIDGRAERRFGATADYDASTQRGTLGYSDGYRDTSGNASVFGQTVREKLPDDTAGSVSSTLGHDRRTDIKQSEYNDEASDDSDASFVTFSNDYATIRNFMKDGDVAPTKYSLSEATDKDYLDAVNRGDTETAQKMVDEAAKKAGYTVKAYHGTRHGGFTVFDDTKNDLGQKGFFFSDSPEVAKSYFKGSDGSLYSEYIRMDNPLVIDGHRRNWDALKFDIGDDSKAYEIKQRKDGYWEIFNIEGRVNIGKQTAWDTKENAEQAYRNAPWVHPTSTILNTTRSIVRYAYNKGEYDGVIIKNTIDMGDSRAKRRISTLYIPFKSEQIKSTDPVTYDDNGNVIPLSQRFNTENDDIRFSLSSAVEETRNLVALHNLTADKLTKSLELGGLPMPSLAITKADIPHSNFGEITLVFGKETIDPKASKKNKVYSADAWTPIFPNVEYEADSKVVSRVSQKLNDLGKMIDEAFQRDLSRIGYSIEDYLNRQGGEEGLVQYVMDNYGLKAAYLEDIGKHIEPVTKHEEVPRKFNPAIADKYLKVMEILGVNTAEEVWDFNLKEARDNHGTELEEVFPGITQSGLRMGKVLGSVAAYINGKDSPIEYKTVIDSDATNKAVNDAIDAEGFEEWTRNLFSGVEKDSGIYNNKDLFTPSGNRRSFKQTHLPVTLENIVKAMASQNDGNSKNVSGFNGVKTLRAATAETFKSIGEMHDRKGRLQHLTQEQADEITDNLHHRLSNIIDAIDTENAQKGDRNPYIRYDQIGQVLSEIGEGGKYNVADIQSVFSEYGRTVSDDTAQDVKQLLYDVTQMPVNIFEAKPERVVGFDEAKVFVIPRNADVKLKQELLNRGYSIAEYDPDVEGDRQKVVNQFEEYRFSLSDAGEQFAPSRNDIYGKDLLKKPSDDIAPIAEDVNPSVENVEADAPVAENVTEENPVAKTADVESLAGDRDSFVSQQAMELYKEITSLKKGVRASKRLGYLLDHGHEWRSIKTALLNIRDNPNQVVNPNSAAESVAREMLGREYDDMVAELAEPSDVAGKIRNKMKHIQTEIANNERLREQSSMDYDSEIAEVQAEYDAKKNKNTLVANNLLRRIERLNRMKNTNDDRFAKRIGDLEARLEKMRQPTYKTAIQRRAKHDEYTNLMKNLVGDTTHWVDKKLGISYKVNTLRRNLRDVVRDANGNRDIAKADAIYDELQGKYNHNEAELKRESRRIKAVFADLKLNHAEDTYAHMLGEFRHNPNSKLTEEVVKEFYEANKGKIDTKKVDKAIEESRKTFDELLVRVNERLKEQGMKEIPYRQGYFPHFTNPKQGWLAKLFNWKTVDTEIPTSIAGLTETFNPERSWQGFSKQRKGDTTDYSLEQGLDTYIHGALDWIYHIEDIQKRRALENHIRYIHSEEGVKAEIDKIHNNEELDADEAQRQIDAVYAEANNPLNNFVTNLRAGTNTLANKKSENDRQMESDTNRKIYSVMTNLNNRISANMVVGSFSSALTNFIPITQSWMEVSPVYSLRGMKDTIKSTIRDDGIVNKSDFLTNRLLNEENLYQTTWDKISDKAAFMMEAIDSFTSQTVWRSKYLQNISEGMSETEAIKNADQFAENVIAGRSRGNQPTIFDAKNPFTKIFTAFQLEVNNQYGYMFKDAPQDSKNKARLIKGYATAFLGAYAYNALYSSLVGRDAAFDPISILEDLFRDMGLFGDDDDEEEPTDVLLNLRDNILEEVPFVGGLMGGGRIPISSALPYSGEYEGLEAFLTDVSEGNSENFWNEVFGSLSYIALPVGGGQIKKTVEGLSMFSDEHPVAGSYTDSGNLRFPVEDTIGNRIQAGLFGQYASENARDYFDNGRSPLKEKQIQEYIDVDIPIRDYWEYREGLADQKTIEDKFDYIAGLDLPVSKKNILINNIVDREESVDLEGYEDFSSYDEFDFATKKPGKYAVSQAVGGFDAYSSYMDVLGDIESDKDESGKSISGSKKEKVINYIESLPIDYGQKIILFKSMYDSKEDRNTYNADIVEYLDSREDISYDEMVTILTELGMRVEGNNVYGD